MESAHRDLLNDMADHRPILKNTHPFWFHTQNRYSIPQNGRLFLLLSIPANPYSIFFASQRKSTFDFRIKNVSVSWGKNELDFFMIFFL